jgi:hypothetical protein
LIFEARFVAQTACFFYMFCSLPETFGRIEVMELWLLLAYPSAVPGKAVAGSHTRPCSGFAISGHSRGESEVSNDCRLSLTYEEKTKELAEREILQPLCLHTTKTLPHTENPLYRFQKGGELTCLAAGRIEEVNCKAAFTGLSNKIDPIFTTA